MSELETRRIPNFLHVLLFLALTIFCFLVAEAIVLSISREPLNAAILDQKLQLIATALTYLFALLAAAALFPVFWQMSFLHGIRWNAARANPLLILAGVALGLVSQAVGSLLPDKGKMPIEDTFHSPGIIWLLVAFGTVLAPLFEEILFRGFLLPAIAILVDWLRLKRSPQDPEASLATLEAWRLNDSFSRLALGTAAVVTSLLFALIHAPQLGLNWPAVSLLAAVSLVLCWVRIRTSSVAASTLVHASYNCSIFVAIFVQTGGFRHLDKL